MYEPDGTLTIAFVIDFAYSSTLVEVLAVPPL